MFIITVFDVYDKQKNQTFHILKHIIYIEGIKSVVAFRMFDFICKVSLLVLSSI